MWTATRSLSRASPLTTSTKRSRRSWAVCSSTISTASDANGKSISRPKATIAPGRRMLASSTSETIEAAWCPSRPSRDLKHVRARTCFKSREGREGHHAASIVSDVELANILRPGAIVAFGLDIDLPLASEAVEIVDEQTAHERLERFVDVVNGDALLNDLVAVHIHKLLGYARQKRGAQAGNFRTLPCGRQEGL